MGRVASFELRAGARNRARTRPSALRSGLCEGVLALLATLLALPLSAQATGRAALDTVKPGSAVPLDEVVVSVTRTGRSVRDVPASVTVLTQASVKSTAAQSVPDLLRHIPGFTMRDFQSSITAHPSRQAPALRGLGAGTSASRTLVLVDGVPFEDPFGGWVHWARVPLDFVERIEVVRGGGSGIWGSRAMAGVINVITERPADRSMRLSAQGGSMSTMRADAAATMRTGKLGVAVMGEYFDSDGFRHVRPDLRGPIDTNAGSQHEMAYAKVEFDVSPRFTVHLNGSYLDEYRPNATPLRYDATEIGFLRGGARWITPDQSVWNLTIHGSAQNHVNVFSTEATDRNTEVLSLDQFDVPATALGGNVQWSKPLSASHELSAGVDVLSVDGEVNEDFAFVQGAFTRRRRVGGEQLLTGVYAQEVFTPTRRLRIFANARLDTWRNRAAFRTERNLLTDAILTDSTYANQSHSQFNYGLGMRLETSNRFAWRASAYAAYRAPSLNELYKPFREAGNVVVESLPSLGAERLKGAEVGADVDVSRSLAAHVTAFWMRVDDFITDITVEDAGATGRNIAPCGFVPAGGVCRQRANLEAFRSAGTELELELRPSAHWLLAGSWLFNPTEVVKAPNQPQLEGKSGRSAAEHSFSVRAGYFNPALIDAAVSGRWVGRRYEDDLNQLELDPFFVVEARVGREIRHGLEAFIAVENLLDMEYEVTRAASGLVRVGTPRSLQAGARVRL